MQFYQQPKMKAVTFSYDDGVVQDTRLINLLNKYNLKCTFNLNSELLGNGGFLFREHPVCHYKIKPEDVKYVYDGHEVAVHTLTHPQLPAESEDEIIRQVEQDRLNLSELVGYEVVGMAYPGGGVNNDDRVAEVIKNHTGVKYARTISSTYSFVPQENLYRFNPTIYHLEFDKMQQLAEDFVHAKPEQKQIFYIWGHSYEMDLQSDYWLKLERLFETLSNRDDIFYGNNTEVLL